MVQLLATVTARDPRTCRTTDTWELSSAESHELLLAARLARVGVRRGSTDTPTVAELADAAAAVAYWAVDGEQYWALGHWLADVVAEGGMVLLK